jgi:hypothetical protein
MEGDRDFEAGEGERVVPERRRCQVGRRPQPASRASCSDYQANVVVHAWVRTESS